LATLTKQTATLEKVRLRLCSALYGLPERYYDELEDEKKGEGEGEGEGEDEGEGEGECEAEGEGKLTGKADSGESGDGGEGEDNGDGAAGGSGGDGSSGRGPSGHRPTTQSGLKLITDLVAGADAALIRFRSQSASLSDQVGATMCTVPTITNERAITNLACNALDHCLVCNLLLAYRTPSPTRSMPSGTSCARLRRAPATWSSS